MAFDSKVIKVEVLDDNKNLLVMSQRGFSVPKDLSSEDPIVKIKGKDLPELDRNTIVSVIMTTKSADRIKYSGAVAVSMDKQLNIKLLKTGESKVLEERRRSFKVKVDEKGRALFFVRDEKTIRFDEPPGISVNDINVGGVFVVCEDFEFTEGDLVCLDIDLGGLAALNAAAYVLRVQREADGTVTGYGCEFQGLTAAQEDDISRYILQKQSELRAKNADFG